MTEMVYLLAEDTESDAFLVKMEMARKKSHKIAVRRCLRLTLSGMSDIGDFPDGQNFPKNLA